MSHGCVMGVMGTVPMTHFFLCENHKNGHFRILVLRVHFLMLQLVLESRYLEKGRQRDEH